MKKMFLAEYHKTANYGKGASYLYKNVRLTEYEKRYLRKYLRSEGYVYDRDKKEYIAPCDEVESVYQYSVKFIGYYI